LISKAVNLSAQPVLAAAASACNSQGVKRKSIHQSIHHSINQSVNQSSNAASNQSSNGPSHLNVSATDAHPLPADCNIMGSISPGGKGSPEPTPFSCLEMDLNPGSPNSQLLMAALSPAYKSGAQ